MMRADSDYSHRAALLTVARCAGGSRVQRGHVVRALCERIEARRLRKQQMQHALAVAWRALFDDIAKNTEELLAKRREWLSK